MKDEFGKLPKDHIDVVAHFAGDLPASMEVMMESDILIRY